MAHCAIHNAPFYMPANLDKIHSVLSYVRVDFVPADLHTLRLRSTDPLKMMHLRGAPRTPAESEKDVEVMSFHVDH